jgi:hypothetical protein
LALWAGLPAAEGKISLLIQLACVYSFYAS